MFPRRGAIAIAITAVALVLLINFKTPDVPVATASGGSSVANVAPAATAPGTTSGGTSTTGGATSNGSSGSSSGTSNGSTTTQTPAAAATAAPAGGTQTVTGQAVDFQYGTVQVAITVSGGKVTEITALQLPTGRRSGEISQYAEPVLRQEAIQAQSANIDTVSGATYTSEAYAQSLQSALDQAGL